MPTISIALATCNGERHLEAQLASLRAQSVPPTELVVSDDGSTDRTLEIVDGFARSAPFPVRVLRGSARLGYQANFMRAAGACEGDLVAFCDQDDEWEPDKLAVMGWAFADPDVLLAYHNDTLVAEDGRPLAPLFGGRAKRFPPLTSFPAQVVPGHTQVFRRSLLRFGALHAASVDPYREGAPMPHDLWFPFWASVLGTIVYLPQRLVRYRLHADNTGGWPVGLAGWIRDNVVNAARYARAVPIGARDRLALLREALRLATPAEVPALERAVALYRTFLARAERRAALYAAPRSPARARALLTLLAQGGYGIGSSAFGLSTLLLDASVGILSPRSGR